MDLKLHQKININIPLINSKKTNLKINQNLPLVILVLFYHQFHPHHHRLDHLQYPLPDLQKKSQINFLTKYCDSAIIIFIQNLI